VKELNTCHFFVHPSYIDNSPNSVCEAMLLGMPVISSSVGGMKTLITNGVNGFLHNPYDEYDLSGLLVHLVNNYSLALDAGRQARAVALERHSPSAIYDRMNQIYNTIGDD
jgi:glycosyltransferase involved in cell wall biosynthesis